MSRVCVGDRVNTSRGPGVVLEVAGPPGFETIAVELHTRVVVDFCASEVTPPIGSDLAQIEAFLAEPSTAERVSAIEEFLAQPPAEVRTAPSGGQTRGARTIPCSCDCGRKGQCFRLSTAPDVHQVAAGNCRCERDCPCA